MWLSAVVGALLAATALAQPERPIRIDKREKKEPVTQALEVTPDPPQAIAAETSKLLFHVSPLSNKGLLSQQIRDALKAIDKANGGAQLVKIRAFVAGTGDLRRVQQIVSEDFSEKRKPLPAISTIQVGALPMEGAQVVLETVSADPKKTVNPHGIGFYPGVAAKDVDGAAAALRRDSAGALLLRVSCFLHSLEGVSAARQKLAAAFPGASLNVLQLTRLSVEPAAFCEGVGRLASGGAPARLVFTGLQLAFRGEDADLRLAAERSRRAMESVKGRDVLFISAFALGRAALDRMLPIDAAAFNKAPGTSLVVEGLPSLDAAVAIELIAAAP